MQILSTPITASGSADASTPQPRLVKAAHEFEAQMMKELMKPMQGTSMLTGEDDDGGDDSAGALGDYATEAFSQALSDHGGFGIANRIVQELSHSSNKSGTVKGNGNVH